MAFFRILNRFVPWWKLPVTLGLLNIRDFRKRYRKKRLHDTRSAIPNSGEPPLPSPPPPRDIRTADGSFNDVQDPQMGRAGTRLGRNFPPEETFQDTRLMEPSPREVSLRLMTRDQFKPATTLNLLAAAWIQFQVHDWFSHGKNPKESPHEIPLKPDDPWPEKPMKIRRTQPDPTRPPDSGNYPLTYLNVETHWWDGSQIYGSTQKIQGEVRSHEQGKLKLTPEGLLPLDDAKGVDFTGVNGNWWVGLSMFHTLFTKEHNAICDHLAAEFPDWDDEKLFQKARLINVALMSKIHTLDWTPGILAHPTIQRGMRAAWYGLQGEEKFRRKGRRGKEVRTGIPASPQEHHAAPYSMTEEFVSVYRMHPLMPDEFTFLSASDGSVLDRADLRGVAGRNARSFMENLPLTDLFYSFGISHPGAITLHNYPKLLQNLVRKDLHVDLAAVDILRDRERGLPRYNQFRRLVFKKPYKKIKQITDNPQWAEELASVYGNDIEQVDLMAGLFAEKLPPGFGFSDTAFRIFSVMAPRRLKSDRFITDDYKPETYTQTGIDWIENNSFRTVVLRHMPALEPALKDVPNPFAPWNKRA